MSDNKNAEGYADPTPAKAIRHMTRVYRDDPEAERLTETIEAIRAVLRVSDFDMVGRITLRSKETGRIYK